MVRGVLRMTWGAATISVTRTAPTAAPRTTPRKSSWSSDVISSGTNASLTDSRNSSNETKRWSPGRRRLLMACAPASTACDGFLRRGTGRQLLQQPDQGQPLRRCQRLGPRLLALVVRGIGTDDGVVPRVGQVEVDG